MRIAYHKIGTVAVLTALLLTGCGGGNEPPPACAADPCPVGAYSMCEPTATPTTCCTGGEEVAACEVPTGILTSDCSACPAGRDVCAVKGGAVDCDPFGQFGDGGAK